MIFPKELPSSEHIRWSNLANLPRSQQNEEVAILTKNAFENGFLGVSLDEISNDETFPGWRDTDGWQGCLDRWRKQFCDSRRNGR